MAFQNSNSKALLVTSIALIASACAVPARASIIVTYDPGLGTLPEGQGFTFHENSVPSPAPFVSAGLLHQGLTSPNAVQGWLRDDVPFNFDAGFTFEGTLRVISSDYLPNAAGPGTQRSGYYLEAIDELGRIFSVGIDGGGVTVNTDAAFSATNGIPRIAFDTTDAFHNYRVSVDGGVGSLFIDGTLVGSTPVGSAIQPTLPNRVFFGDGSDPPRSQTQLSFFQYSTSTAVVPEPSSICIFAVESAMLLGFLCWRRRHRKAVA